MKNLIIGNRNKINKKGKKEKINSKMKLMIWIKIKKLKELLIKVEKLEKNLIKNKTKNFRNKFFQ